jgi:hypothetical protein
VPDAMGLDYVELVMAIENKFAIYISDEEAGNVRTIGDLYRVVLSKVGGESKGEPGQCLTSIAFYRARRGLVDTLGLDRRDVRPSTTLEPILPWRKRRRLWTSIQAKTELRIPSLRHPGWIQVLLIAAGLVAAILTLRLSPVRLNVAIAGAVSLLGGLCAGVLLIRITPPLAVALPSGVATVGDLARNILAINYPHLLEEVGQQNRRDVWDTLCIIMVEQLGVKANQLLPEASIVDDLRVE